MEYNEEDKWIKQTESLQKELEQKLKKTMTKQEKQTFFQQYQHKLDTLLADMQEYDQEVDEQIRAEQEEMNTIIEELKQSSKKDNPNHWDCPFFSLIA